METMGQDRGVPEQGEGSLPPLEPPTQEALDLFFEIASVARVYLGGPEQGTIPDRRPVAGLTGEPLQTLHQALTLREESPPAHCPCLGDLTIELAGSEGQVAVLSLHYHAKPLLGYKGWSSDAELGERHELFKLLMRCGLEPVVERMEKDLRADQRERMAQMEHLWLSGAGRIPVGDILTKASKKQSE